MMSIRALEAAMKNSQTIFPTAQLNSKPIRRRRATCARSARSARFARSCVCRAIIFACWSRGKTRALAHNFIAAERTRTACMPRLRNSGLRLRRDRTAALQALVRTAQEALRRKYAQYASRLSPDVGADRSRGRRSGLSGELYRPNIPVDGSQARKSSKGLALPPPGDGDQFMLGEGDRGPQKIETRIQDELKTRSTKIRGILPARANQGSFRPSSARQTDAEAESATARVCSTSKLPEGSARDKAHPWGGPLCQAERLDG